MVDARLADGSRVNAVIPPLAIDGPSLTIRKFAKQRLTVDDLDRVRHADARGHRVPRRRASQGRLNILISGGTGTGKTTLLNVLSSLIPEDERIVTIEDAAELQLDQDHVIRLESRPANLEGRGDDHDPRPGPQRAAHAARPHHRRRGPRRRGARHAPGHEHRPRRLAVDAARQLAARRAVPARDHDAHGRHRAAAAGDPRPGRVGARPRRAPQPPARRLAAGHADLRGRRHRGRRRQPLRPLRVRLRGRASTRTVATWVRSCRPACGPAFAERLRDLGIELPARLLGIDAAGARTGPESSDEPAPGRRAGGSWMLVVGAGALFGALFLVIAAITLPARPPAPPRRGARRAPTRVLEPLADVRARDEGDGARRAGACQRTTVSASLGRRARACRHRHARAGVRGARRGSAALGRRPRRRCCSAASLLGARRRRRSRSSAFAVAVNVKAHEAAQAVRGAAARLAALIAGGLRAGHSLPQAIDALVQEAAVADERRVPAGALRDPARPLAARRAARPRGARSAARTSSGSCRRSRSSATSVATSPRCSTT